MKQDLLFMVEADLCHCTTLLSASSISFILCFYVKPVFPNKCTMLICMSYAYVVLT